MSLMLGILFSYFLGAIPFGYLAVRFIAGKDIRKLGSGNTGATNVYRLLGMKWAIAVFLLDCGKGCLAVFSFPSFFAPAAGEKFALACGLSAILGHMYPVFLKFKGGKGVAVSVGVILALGLRNPLLLLSLFLALLLWGLTFKLFRYVSAASLTAAAGFFIFTLIFNLDRTFQGFAFLVMVGIIFRHRHNIQRLINRKELRISR